MIHPNVRLARRPDHTVNFSDLIDNSSDETTEAEMDTEPAPANAQDKPFRFALHRTPIINGDIVFDDQAINIAHRFSPLNFELPKLSSLEGDSDIFSQPGLTGRTNDPCIAVATGNKLFTDTLETIVDRESCIISYPAGCAYKPAYRNPESRRISHAFMFACVKPTDFANHRTISI